MFGGSSKKFYLLAAKTTSISIQAWQRMAEKKKVDYTAIQAANERGSLGITDLLQGKQFDSIADVNAYLQKVVEEGGPPEARTDTPLKKAQQVAYDAMEASGQRRVELARRALEVSRDCADAWVLLADAEDDPQKALEYAREAAAAGERVLGKEYIENEAGNFWLLIETRPYMRALFSLAENLRIAGDMDEAFRVYQEMLRLNPADNQGVRDIIAQCFAEADRDDLLEMILARYGDDPGASIVYGRALRLFRKEGPGEAANKALDDALRQNPFVTAYLLGERPYPRRLPDYYSFGDQNEAIIYALGATGSWAATPGALAWLKARAAINAVGRGRTRRRQGHR